MKNRGPFEMARQYIQTAREEYDSGCKDLESFRYAKSIRSFQICIEQSLKAVHLILEVEYQRKHSQKEPQFKKLIESVPSKLSHINFPRLFVISKLWSTFYTIAKYGLQDIEVGPHRIFSEKEANLAKEHAWEWYLAGTDTYEWIFLEKLLWDTVEEN